MADASQTFRYSVSTPIVGSIPFVIVGAVGFWFGMPWLGSTCLLSLAAFLIWQIRCVRNQRVEVIGDRIQAYDSAGALIADTSFAELTAILAPTQLDEPAGLRLAHPAGSIDILNLADNEGLVNLVRLRRPDLVLPVPR